MPDNTEKRIYSVSEITASIKSLLEDRFPFVWISGEISNFQIPSSGHFYFTLKDNKAQISAVMFRGQNRNLNFDLDDGQHIIGLGRISVYEPRGTYQIIFEYIEPKGIGALQIAFEQLKKRLADEGLFDDRNKSDIPYLPNKISVVTSPTGAVVHDIAHVVFRRYPNIHIEVVPARVQGDGSVEEIVTAITLLNERMDTDVIILARGGGSLEDLQAFNSEAVARAIHESRIPIISAVGHEIDYTICDFVSDLRAPTPSAAAELVVPLKKDLMARLLEIEYLLKSLFNRYLNYKKENLLKLSKRLTDPKRKIQDMQLKLDDLVSRLIRTTLSVLHQNHDRLSWRKKSLITNNPGMLIKINNNKIEQSFNNIINLILNKVNNSRFKLKELTSQLLILDPKGVLKRGYSITRTLPEAVVVHDSESVSLQQKLEILLEKGVLICRVERKSNHGKKDL